MGRTGGARKRGGGFSFAAKPLIVGLFLSERSRKGTDRTSGRRQTPGPLLEPPGSFSSSAFSFPSFGLFSPR